MQFSIKKGATDKKWYNSHRRISFQAAKNSFQVQAVSEAVAIKLIGYSFHFHVAYLFRENQKMIQLAQYFTLKEWLNKRLDKLEND